MTTKRMTLVGLGAAVIAALVFLAFSASSGDGGDPVAKPVREAVDRERTEVVEMGSPRVRPAIQQRIEAGEQPPVASDGDPTHRVLPDGTTEYMRDDGTTVRDHRTAVEQQLRPRAIQPTTTAALRADLRPMVKDCARPIRQRDSTIRFDLQVTPTVSIRDRTLRIDQLDVQVAGLEDEDFTACVRAALEGLELKMPEGQDDVATHTISLPFRLP